MKYFVFKITRETPRIIQYCAPQRVQFKPNKHQALSGWPDPHGYRPRIHVDRQSNQFSAIAASTISTMDVKYPIAGIGASLSSSNLMCKKMKRFHSRVPTKRNENTGSRQPLDRHGHHSEKLEAPQVSTDRGTWSIHTMEQDPAMEGVKGWRSRHAPPCGKCLQQVIPETESGPVVPRDNGQ